MTITTLQSADFGRRSHPFVRLLDGQALRAAACLFAACLSTLAGAKTATGSANGPAEAFKQLSADPSVSRQISFAELGFTGPLVLGAPDTRREIYLPVPANVRIRGGEIKLNASYLRADGGRTAFAIALDTYPVSARPFAADKGDASIVLAVDGAPRASGFVRLGLNWSTALGADVLCTDARTPGNLLRIEPDSTFSYRYEGGAIVDLATAWGTLPAAPVILIAGRNLSAPAYDSAWRLGVALERAGKHGVIRALPAIGDSVNLDGITIPAGLRNLPAFAALAQGGNVKLSNAAEIGALLSLGQSGPLRADIVVVDPAMAAAMAAAFDALRAQLNDQAPDAVAAFDDWRTRLLDPTNVVPAAKEIRLGHAFGRPVIVVAADAGAKAAGLFGAYWNRVAVGSAMVVGAADEANGDASAVSLAFLGGKPGSFDVLAHADWNASFDIGAVAADGRVPGTLVLDVAAAPSAARTPPVVSVFMNDILLAAGQMTADGKRERITAAIPRYALAARNILRLSFVRQLASDRCRETPEAYPVSVLPSSHLLLVKATPSDDFNGMAARFAGGANVMVPASFLADSPASLARLIRLATTTGVSPVTSRFTVVSGDAVPAPGGAFIALDLPFKGGNSRVKLENGHVVMTAGNGKPILDTTGLDDIAIIEVVNVGGDSGVVYRNAGRGPGEIDKPILLSTGDIAIIGANGLLREINSSDPGGRAAAGIGESGGISWLLARGYWWTVPIIAIIFMVALLVFASRMRRRRAASKSDSQRLSDTAK